MKTIPSGIVAYSDDMQVVDKGRGAIGKRIHVRHQTRNLLIVQKLIPEPIGHENLHGFSWRLFTEPKCFCVMPF